MSILDEYKDTFRSHPLIIKIIFILLVISFFHDIITGEAFSIYFSVCLISLVVAEIVNWLFYSEKEEK
ncbi:MAG: hypothetical protein K6A34_08715 [Methanobrevibacter sp.]|nr:hypothetical protein [Methanobrevibacter sp.]